MKTRNKLLRMSKVLSMAFIIFLQIYWYKIRRKPQAEWDILWGKIGERYRKTLFELEGLLIKGRTDFKYSSRFASESIYQSNRGSDR